MNIEKIVEVVNSSGLVISPTDTVYGITMEENGISKLLSMKMS